MPGTALVIGVRKPAGGAITSRSVCGVNANGGSAGSELLGGVVAGFAVVRSVLSKQVGSAIPAWRRFSRRSHRAAAEAGMLPEAKTVRATMFNTKTIERYIEVLRSLCSHDAASRSEQRQTITSFDRLGSPVELTAALRFAHPRASVHRNALYNNARSAMTGLVAAARNQSPIKSYARGSGRLSGSSRIPPGTDR